MSAKALELEAMLQYSAVQTSREGVFNRNVSSTVGGVVWSVSCVANPLPKRHTSRICEGHEDLSSCKVVLEAIKRSLPVLKWTSESEYFLSFKFFCRIYIYIIYI